MLLSVGVMNSFHNLTIALNNKNKIEAMLVIRDKPESIVKKILAKAGIGFPGCSGRVFWKWVQDYIFTVCAPAEVSNDEPSVSDTPATVKYDSH